ncbi:hypothetical protein WA556_004752, partial [Blastocystis sp. ATCC 50177/Nand II]
MGNADEELQLFLQCDCAISSDEIYDRLISLLMCCVFDFASFSEEQRILFGNHLLSIVARNANNPHCIPLLQFYYHQAMKYGSIVCRTTMLLILIKLKEAYPDVIESFMKDEVSILQSPVLLPKERELLLRLLISYLPPSAVLSVIQNSSPSSSASIIHSLCHLPVDVLLEEYLSVESGLLNTDDSLVVDSIVDLLIAIARHSSHFQRIQLIQILFKRMHKSKKNTAAFLQCVSSLLENTYYITSSSEQELLVQFAQEEALREPS